MQLLWSLQSVSPNLPVVQYCRQPQHCMLSNMLLVCRTISDRWTSNPNSCLARPKLSVPPPPTNTHIRMTYVERVLPKRQDGEFALAHKHWGSNRLEVTHWALSQQPGEGPTKLSELGTWKPYSPKTYPLTQNYYENDFRELCFAILKQFCALQISQKRDFFKEGSATIISLEFLFVSNSLVPECVRPISHTVLDSCKKNTTNVPPMCIQRCTLSVDGNL